MMLTQDYLELSARKALRINQSRDVVLIANTIAEFGATLSPNHVIIQLLVFRLKCLCCKSSDHSLNRAELIVSAMANLTE